MAHGVGKGRKVNVYLFYAKRLLTKHQHSTMRHHSIPERVQKTHPDSNAAADRSRHTKTVESTITAAGVELTAVTSTMK